MAKTDEVADVIAALVDAYPRMQVEARTVKVYCMALGDIPVAELRAAALRLMGTSKFFPTIAELRESWALSKTGPKRSGMDAWADVKAAVSKYGYQRTPEFACPMVAAAVKTLGWVQICVSENEAADRAHFAKAYESIQARNLEAVALGKAGLKPELPAPAPVRELAPVAEAAPAQDIASAVKSVLGELAGGGQ